MTYVEEPNTQDWSAPTIRRRRARLDADMDMTPMVDVTFLLLIFFMITAAFALQKSLEVPTKSSDEASSRARTLQDIEQDPSYVVVRLDEFSTYHVSSPHLVEEVEAPSRQDLIVALRSVRSQAGDSGPTKMLLMCHGDAIHERVVQGIDAGTTVGMEDVQVMTSGD